MMKKKHENGNEKNKKTYPYLNVYRTLYTDQIRRD